MRLPGPPSATAGALRFFFEKEVNPMPRPDTPSFSVALKLSEDLYTRSRVLAAVRRTSLAELVRQGLRQLLEAADDLPTLPPTRNAA